MLSADGLNLMVKKVLHQCSSRNLLAMLDDVGWKNEAAKVRGYTRKSAFPSVASPSTEVKAEPAPVHVATTTRAAWSWRWSSDQGVSPREWKEARIFCKHNIHCMYIYIFIYIHLFICIYINMCICIYDMNIWYVSDVVKAQRAPWQLTKDAKIRIRSTLGKFLNWYACLVTQK